MGSFFDIAGVTGELHVASNYELESKVGESNIMYWRCETVFQNINNKDLTGELKADFNILYNE